MRVLHVITDLNTGGAEKLMVDLLPRLAKDEIEVELVVFNGVITPFFEALSQAGIKIHKFDTKANYYSPRHIVRLVRLARQFDIVHTHNTAPQLFGAIASMFCRKKWITTEHTTTSHRRVWWYRPIERWMYRRYAAVVAISEGAAAAVREVTGKKGPEIRVIPNGVDLARYEQASSLDRASIGRSLRDKKVILMVGRLSYQKDQATIIRAMTKLPENVELWLAGNGETEAALKTLALETGVSDRVCFLGMRTDVPALLKAADIVVQSSHIEGFGLAAVEAMAAGKPVIASDIPGLHDVVGGAGLLFEHENDNQLADGVTCLLNDEALYNALIEKGRQRAKRYGINQMAERYLDVYSVKYTFLK